MKSLSKQEISRIKNKRPHIFSKEYKKTVEKYENYWKEQSMFDEV